MAFNKDTKGQNDLRRLQNKEFELFSEEDILNSDMNLHCKKAVLYVAKVNSLTAVPSKSDIRLNIAPKEYIFETIEGRKMVFSITVPEMLNFYEIDPVIRRDCLPKELVWLKPYIKKMGTNSNGKSWRDRKENPRKSRYPVYFIANVKDERGPCYESLGLHIKR